MTDDELMTKVLYDNLENLYEYSSETEMRENKHSYFMKIAEVVATRATCLRRAVGCVLVNDRGHILSTGYNGVAAGLPHCNDKKVIHVDGCAGEHIEYEYPNKCSGADSPSGTNLGGCEAIHAEQNALLQCKDVYSIQTAYVTTAPCIHCLKLLLNTSCQRIVFLNDYPQSEQSRDMWQKAGRLWQKFSEITLQNTRSFI